ncbi:hypothetical protein [Aquisalimonas sp.]|nr:hypothetical protein [Aquisalimonas sp.]
MARNHGNIITTCAGTVALLAATGTAQTQGEFSVGVFSDYIDNGE